MKKRRMTVAEYINISGVYTIIIENIRYQKNFFNIIQSIIKEILVDEDVFLSFYRTDGVNLTLKKQRELEKEIPLFIRENGEIQTLSEYLALAKIHFNNKVYNCLPFIFDYYLETIIFKPKVDWETFKQYQLNYQEHRFDDIILNQFAEALFCYFDSGDFLICFNPQIYNPVDVKSMIKEVLTKTNQGTVQTNQGTVL